MMLKVLMGLSPRAKVQTAMIMVITDMITITRMEKSTKLENVIMDTTHMDMDINE